MLVEKKLRDFSDEVASLSPAPGGGSVSALCGSLSAALSSMVCGLTIGKEKYASVESDMKSVFSESEEIRAQLLGLVDEDTDAFNAVMDAFKLPKGSDERRDALQKAFKGAAEAPLRTSKLCHRAMELSVEALEKGNQKSITDAAVAGLVAYAGLQGAVLNVLINLPSIKDEAFVSEARGESQRLTESANILIEKIMNSAIKKL